VLQAARVIWKRWSNKRSLKPFIHCGQRVIIKSGRRRRREEGKGGGESGGGFEVVEEEGV